MGETGNPVTQTQAVSRLCACLSQSERDTVLVVVMKLLAQRCRPTVGRLASVHDDPEREVSDEELDSFLLGAMPREWPGQQQVNLSNIDSTGDLMEACGEAVSQILIGWAWDDEANAETLADEYLRSIRELGLPLPSDFGDDPCFDGWTEEDEQQTRREFVAFLRHWREVVIQTLERQTSSAEPD